MARKAKAEILANTREMLSMAEAGLADATGDDPRRRRPGLMNLFTYGRSVTFAIQTMKSADPEFVTWWEPYQEKMDLDPLMKYFNTTRTEVLHEGALPTGSTTRIGAEGWVDIGALVQELNRHAPPNTIGTFFGESRTGGDGWVVRLPDGSEGRVYFTLPDSVDVKSTLHLPDPPTEHDGKRIMDTSIANLGTVYLMTLRRIVEEFEARFR